MSDASIKWPSPPKTPSSLKDLLNDKDEEPAEVFRRVSNASQESFETRNRDPAVVEYKDAPSGIADQPLFGPEIVANDHKVRSEALGGQGAGGGYRAGPKKDAQVVSRGQVAKRKFDGIANGDIRSPNNLNEPTSTSRPTSDRKILPLPASRRQNYRLGTSSVQSSYSADPVEWHRRQLEHLAMLERHCLSASGNPPPKKKSSAGPVNRPRPDEVVKDTGRSRKRTATRPRQSESESLVARSSTITRSTPQQPAASSPMEASSASDSHTPLPKRKGGKKGIKHDETSYQDVLDFCPPLSTLNGKHINDKPEWPGQRIDLSGDDDRHALHPYEIEWAEILRVPCNAYMVVKRCVFLWFIVRTSVGKPFSKTHAQDAVSIDVNKGSALYSMFQKAGWLDKESPYWKNFFSTQTDTVEKIKRYCWEKSVGNWSSIEKEFWPQN